MSVRRVAVIFDNTARPETTGVYCRRALGRLVGEVEHVLPTELARIPRGRFDLFLAVDDGLSYEIPPDLRPLGYWAIDTHLDFGRSLTRARRADLVFAAQRDGAERLRGEGIDTATWLPLACDPEMHRKIEAEKRYDWCFVGNVFPGEREALLARLARAWPSHFVGRAYFEEMAAVYGASRLAFNRSVRDDVNMRVFEALACGSLLLTNDLAANGQAELLRDGAHLAAYRDAEDLLEKAAWYLRHEEPRERIAAAGRAEALARHTYRHRMEVILEAASRAASRSVVPVIAPADKSVKETGYFEFARPEVLALVPESARRVLDVGCGAGRLGESLKRRRPAEVVGVELDPRAARLARGRLDDVRVGNVEGDEIDFPAGRFDCVVMADVLEHLRHPRRVLEKVRRWLAPGGCLVASVPNVRNHTVVTSLLDGNFTYEPAGLLDEDHVRLFTRREIEKLLFRAGFAVERLGVTPGEGYAEWAAAGRPGELAVGGLRIAGLPPEEVEEFYAYQYLVRAAPAPAEEYGLTSVVIVTHNELPYTRQCLEVLRFVTDEPFELIVVDNGSTDGTPESLRAQGDVRLVENRENRGFPAAANQGIALARGAQVLLLNNDTLPTTGWLRRLLRALHGDPQVGLAGPCSNNVSGEQRVEAGYGHLSGLDGFAWEWSKAHEGERVETDRLVGFCLLIRREVIERVGLLDERFGVGCYEDDDFCRRAAAAGYKGVIARDAFVHHFGSRTFLGSGADLAGVLDENRRKYDEKWEGLATAGGSPPETPPGTGAAPPASAPGAPPRRLAVTAAPGGGLLLEENRVRLSLCLIVRDNEGTIGACLESIRPWVDEIVVVDTGSKDRTPAICREHGARLYQFPWCDDFSAARNESLKHARGEWLFWMDSDDTISEECGRGLRALADGPHAEDVLGYVVQVHCPGPGEEGADDVTVVDHVKLFRNRPELRFEGRIHEQIIPAIRRVGGEVAWTELYVTHSGSDHTPEGRRRKLERDFRILRRELEEQPDHPFVLFNLGMTCADARQYDEAVDSLRRSLAASHPHESHVRKCYALLVSALAQSERHEAAWEACREGLSLYPEDKELLFREALLHQHFGRLAEAERTYLRVLSETEERHFTSVDAGIGGHKARHNLALVYEDMGRAEEAESQWRRITEERPGYAPAWRGLGEILLRGGRLGEASDLARRLYSVQAHRAEGLVLAARVAEAQGDPARAAQALRAGLEDCPGELSILREMCRLTFEHSGPQAAEPYLEELARRDPADASALHNLGTSCLSSGRLDAAVRHFRRSLEIRPRAAQTESQLAAAHEALRRAGLPEVSGATAKA